MMGKASPGRDARGSRHSGYLLPAVENDSRSWALTGTAGNAVARAIVVASIFLSILRFPRVSVRLCPCEFWGS